MKKVKILVHTPNGKTYETVYAECSDESLDNFRDKLKNPKYLTFTDMHGYECFFTKEMLGHCVVRLKVKE